MASCHYNLYRYSLPIQTKLILRGVELPQREGLLVTMQYKQKQGWGEIAPLPSFSLETLDQAQTQALTWLKKWQQAEGKYSGLSLDKLYHSVAFGLSCALAEMENELGQQGNFQSAPLYCSSQKIPQWQGKSSPIFKLKIGIQSPTVEGQQVQQYLASQPDLRLRLDANRRWTLAQALAFAQPIEQQCRGQIQFIEEPCQSPAESLKFAQQTGINIAWDETTRELDFKLKHQPYLRAIVIKPSLIGSLQRCIRLIDQAHKLGLQAVISSSIESSFGLTQLARIALQYTPESLPGLDTLNLMPYQLVRKWQGSNLPVVELNSAFVRQII